MTEAHDKKAEEALLDAQIDARLRDLSAATERVSSSVGFHKELEARLRAHRPHPVAAATSWLAGRALPIAVAANAASIALWILVAREWHRLPEAVLDVLWRVGP